MNGDFSFEIMAHIGVIQQHQTGWTKELNIISWNGNSPKYDIRDWSPNHEHMSRGITLNEAEMARMIEAVAEKGKEIKLLFDNARKKEAKEMER